ncbi:hypothetical protein [Pararhizobium sp. LjRoot238]|uniref:hypothetical protein n=1 Tax=Pararhizobium sp. LjRoot238 TaxID=3342293 RepID=UPI003ECEC20A
MDDTEIEEVLRRLVSRDLTEIEIINASLRRNDTRRATHLDRIGTRRPIHFGENPYYIAAFEKD